MHLSARQTEIVRRIARGESDKEIAHQLGLSHATVRTHLQRIYLANGFHNRAEAVAAWLGRSDGSGQRIIVAAAGIGRE